MSLSHSSFTNVTADATKLPFLDNSVDLIITHPPYIGIDTSRYGGDPKLQINYGGKKKMVKLLTKAMEEMRRVLKDQGSIFIATNNSEEMSQRVVLAAVDKVGLRYMGSIFQHSYDFEPDFKPEERLVENSVTVWHHFSIKDIYYNPFMVKKFNDPVWRIPFDNQDGILDSINRAIPERFIQMFSKPGAVVLDPFGGSGVVAVTACELGRKGISSDVSPAQTIAAEKRYKKL